MNHTIIKKQKAVNINGEEYFTVQQFAKLTNRTEISLRLLLSKGNKVRPLKAIHFFDKPFIPVQELFDYPFVVPGKPLNNRLLVEKFVLDEKGDLKVIEQEYKI